MLFHYSNAHRGKKRKAEVDPSHPPIIDEKETYVPSKGWAEMIRKVYEIDPPSLSKMRWPDVDHRFYRRPCGYRQDHQLPEAHFLCRTASTPSYCPTGTSDGN